jgi:hypothetical protein
MLHGKEMSYFNMLHGKGKTLTMLHMVKKRVVSQSITERKEKTLTMSYVIGKICLSIFHGKEEELISPRGRFHKSKFDNNPTSTTASCCSVIFLPLSYFSINNNGTPILFG